MKIFIAVIRSRDRWARFEFRFDNVTNARRFVRGAMKSSTVIASRLTVMEYNRMTQLEQHGDWSTDNEA